MGVDGVNAVNDFDIVVNIVDTVNDSDTVDALI